MSRACDSEVKRLAGAGTVARLLDPILTMAPQVGAHVSKAGGLDPNMLYSGRWYHHSRKLLPITLHAHITYAASGYRSRRPQSSVGDPSHLIVCKWLWSVLSYVARLWTWAYRPRVDGSMMCATSLPARLLLTVEVGTACSRWISGGPSSTTLVAHA